MSDGFDTYCALLTSSGVDCWGYGYDGELGNGTFSESATPVAVEGVGGAGTLTGVTSLVGDGSGYCALLTSGEVDCWGLGVIRRARKRNPLYERERGQRNAC